MTSTAACFAAASDALGAASPPLSERIPLSSRHRTRHPSWRGEDGHASRKLWSTELAEAGMSALSAVLPSWSTVLLVLLIGILALSYWVVRGVSVETLSRFIPARQPR